MSTPVGIRIRRSRHGRREAVLAAGEEATDEEEDEEEPALAMGSPKQVEMGVGPERIKPDAGAKEVVPESGEMAASVEDIVED